MWSDPGDPNANLLNGVEPSTPLFRFLSTKRFLELVRNGGFELCRPSRWEDPFENFLSKTTFVKDGQPIAFNLTNDFFGQCWTLRAECDGLWRSYCGKELDDGVRIETTAEKLIRAIWDGNDGSPLLRTFVGQVRYLSDDALKAEFQGCLEYGHGLMSPNGDGMAQVLLIKRTEFAYEYEVRALVADPGNDGDFKAIRITPADFIDSVLFAPKMDSTQ